MRCRWTFRVLAACAALSLGTATGCGGSADPVRIGIITDCGGAGLFSQYREPAIAGAELPMIQRGATLSGDKPSDGVEGASVAGRPVRLVIDCAETLNPGSALSQLRWLVEERHVGAVVGPTTEVDPIVARYARAHPGVVFMLASYDQSSTLRYAAPNLYRFELDAAPVVSGSRRLCLPPPGLATSDDFGRGRPSRMVRGCRVQRRNFLLAGRPCPAAVGRRPGDAPCPLGVEGVGAVGRGVPRSRVRVHVRIRQSVGAPPRPSPAAGSRLERGQPEQLAVARRHRRLICSVGEHSGVPPLPDRLLGGVPPPGRGHGADLLRRGRAGAGGA